MISIFKRITASRELFIVDLKLIKLVLRKMNQFDLLGVCHYAPIFFIDERKKQGKVQPILNVVNQIQKKDDTALDDKRKAFEDKRRLVLSCIIKVRAKVDQDTIDMALQDETIIEQLFRIIQMKSSNVKYLVEVNQEKATMIYFMYKGLNYAELYFGMGVLNKIEEFAFNALIHNTGVKEENKRNKEIARGR